MQYNVRHVTRFTYDTPISESVMEARVQPRTEGTQRCVRFSLNTTPAARIRMYQDPEGNIVHHFNIPGRISRLSVIADALVELTPASQPLPGHGPVAWEQLDAATASGAHWEWMNPSPFARPTERLRAFATELGVVRGDDPLAALKAVNAALYSCLTYSPKSTRVDSPIDEALESRKGVCQDFTHIMIALVRLLGVPCRYVSGYLFHQADDDVRSPDGSTHAWAEAWLPEVGWVGFDPTNNLAADHRHIRVAVGRDYADVPPTRGVFKGLSAVRNELSVSVRVGTSGLTTAYEAPAMPWVSREVPQAPLRADQAQQQQQQQQQQ